MNKIEKLLEGVEVEWKELGEVIKLKKGKQLNKEHLTESGLYPAYNGGVTYSGFTDKYNYKEDTIIISQGGASAGFVNFVTTKFYANAHCYVILPNIQKALNRYVYHFLKQNQYKLTNKQHGAGIPALKTSEILKLSIPIPPLEVQEEIVEILDKFTKLTAELTAELTAREQQYEYYREKLLSFDKNRGGYKIMTLNELGKFTRGGGLQKKDFTEFGVGCIHYGQIHTYYGTYATETLTFVSEEFAEKARKAKYGDLVIATTSEDDEDLGKAVAWLGEEEIAVSSDACFYSHNMHPKYVAYFFQTHEFHKQKRQFITGTKVRRINADNLAKIKIPVPSLEEQERIVNILDKFDILTSSISEGLPREIELREQQYEYYREKCLNFDFCD